MIMQEVVGHCIWKKVSCNYLRNNGFYISYLRAQYFILYCLILAIAKYPFNYILWCHIWRHFYPLRLLLILLGWLHQVVDHLYLGLSPTKFKSSRASATHPHQIDSILASLMSSPDPLLLLLHTHLQHDDLKVFPKLSPDYKVFFGI